MKRNKLIKHLEKNGCTFVRQGGNHTLYRNAGVGMFRLPAATAFSAFLNRRTFYTAVRAKNAAVSRFGFHNRSTMGALVKELTGIRRHDLFFAETALRTGYH